MVFGEGCLFALFIFFLLVFFFSVCLVCCVRSFLLVLWFGIWGFFCGEGYYYLFGLSFKFHYTSSTCCNEREPWRYKVVFSVSEPDVNVISLCKASFRYIVMYVFW